MTVAMQPPNPWLSMWLRPRATVRYLIENDPDRQLPLLAMLNGIIFAFSRLSPPESAKNSIAYFFGTVTGAIVGGAIIGLVWLYLAPPVLSWVGRKLGGCGTSSDVRTAWAWSGIPTVWGGFLLIPQLTIVGFMVAIPEVSDFESYPLLLLPLFGLALLTAALRIWGVVVFLHSLAEAHDFSIWRALGTTLLSFLLVPLLVLGPFVCIGIISVPLSK